MFRFFTATLVFFIFVPVISVICFFGFGWTLALISHKGNVADVVSLIGVSLVVGIAVGMFAPWQIYKNE